MDTLPRPVKKNQQLTVSIASLGFEGVGIVKYNPTPETRPFTLMVHHSYPGDTVTIQVTKVKSNYAEAKVLEVITAAPERIAARCEHFGTCGGCKQQDLSYAAQLFYKEQQTHDILERIGKITGYTAEPIVGCDVPFFYRNKMEFSFTPKRWLSIEEIASGKIFDDPFALGFHLPGVFDKAINIGTCYLQSEESNGILRFTGEFFRERGLRAFDLKTGEGYLKNLVIREGKKTGERMVNLVTGYDAPELMQEYTEGLLKLFPGLTTVLNNISARKSSIAVGESEKVYHGTGTITDTIGPLKFRISANSFFQTNTIQAVKLYNKALEYAGLTGNEVVYDLYCGAGTITSFLACAAKQVYGFEVVESAVEDARYNAALNGITNAEFFRTDLFKPLAPEIVSLELPSPDVVVLDPPRAGLHGNTIKDVLEINAERIVYVSCNPASLARDLDLLRTRYTVEKVTPVDMFPQTYHIEVVTQLRRID